MNKKLNCILLIDDDEATNLLNQIVVEKSGCAEKCIAVQSGIEALEYLTSRKNGGHPQPDLILLDINMPAMNGWEFMDAYKELDSKQKGQIVIVMLTTSLNPDDEEKSRTYDEIQDFKNKPLTVKMLQGIVEKHFEHKAKEKSLL